MSKILEKALERARLLPEDRQDELGELILEMLGQEQSDAQLTPAQEEEVRRRIDEPHPIIATDEQVEAFFRKLTV